MADRFGHLTLALAIAGAVLASAGCSRGDSAKPAFHAVDITGAEYANALDLPDIDGRRRTLADFKGKVTVVFFGYTQCPDVCPTTLLELAQLKKALGATGARLQPVFVTLDPERDTPALLRAYVDNFGGDIVALRGSPDETRAAAKNFKVFYSRANGKDGAAYTIDHTAGSYVFDAAGRVRLFSRYGAGADALAADVKQLLADGS